jgi:hypothetical protein
MFTLAIIHRVDSEASVQEIPEGALRSILELRRRHGQFPRARVQHFAGGWNETVMPGQ